MYKIWTRGLLRQFNNSYCQRLYASFTVRDVLNERSDDSGSLLVRFAKHIAIECQTTTPLVQNKIRYADYFPISNDNYFRKELQKTSADQLPFLLTYAFTYKSNADPVKFAGALNDIDAAAMRRLHEMDLDTILRTLYSFIFLMPSWITRTDFYSAAMKRLATELPTDAPLEKFVQVCFYLGFDKKHNYNGSGATLLRRFLPDHLEQHLPHLTGVNLAIVANAAYKTATKVQNPNYSEHLIKETLALPLDNSQDALLVTFVKALRLERVRSESVCEYLAKICTDADMLSKLQVRGLVHIFAYFAENLWDKKEHSEALVNEFMARLRYRRKFDFGIETPRGKDIDTFVWCCAQLNASLTSGELERIENVLLSKIRDNEFRYYVDQLIDTCLCLWTLGHKSRELLDEVVHLKRDAVNPKQQKQQPKVDSRYTVLLSSVAIEQQSWLPRTKEARTKPFDLEQPMPVHLSKQHAEWEKYAEEIAGADESITQVKVVCPIKGINIPGLLVELSGPEDAKVFVEVLGEENTLKFSKEPTAMLRLKMRLLKALGNKVVLLPADKLATSVNQLKEVAGVAIDDAHRQAVKNA